MVIWTSIRWEMKYSQIMARFGLHFGFDPAENTSKYLRRFWWLNSQRNGRRVFHLKLLAVEIRKEPLTKLSPPKDTLQTH